MSSGVGTARQRVHRGLRFGDPASNRQPHQADITNESTSSKTEVHTACWQQRGGFLSCVLLCVISGLLMSCCNVDHMLGSMGQIQGNSQFPLPVSQAHIMIMSYFYTKFWMCVCVYTVYMYMRGGVVVKALCYKPAGCGSDSRWCHWNFSVT
jgi:hypothetical protein